jgi:hypothetical protein
VPAHSPRIASESDPKRLGKSGPYFNVLNSDCECGLSLDTPYWLGTSVTAARRIKLEPEALAKLMLAEPHYPELFGQLLGWLAAGNVA